MKSNILPILVVLVVAQIYSAYSLEAILHGKLPTPLSGQSGFYDGNQTIFLIGGIRKSLNATSDIQQYNIFTNNVTSAGHFPDGSRIYAAAVGDIGNGSFLHFGGYIRGSGELPDAISAIWAFSRNASPTKIGDMPYPLGQLNTASDGNGNIYIAGGYDSRVSHDHLLKYSAHSGAIVPRFPQTFQSMASAYANGFVYVFCGNVDAGEIYKYNPTTHKVTVVGTMPQLTGATAFTVLNSIYLVGGLGLSDEQFYFYHFDTVTEVLKSIQVANVDKMVYQAYSVYVEALNRIYMFGGMHSITNVYYDDIYYIQL